MNDKICLQSNFMSTYNYNLHYKRPINSYEVTLDELCTQAGIKNMVTGGPKKIWIVDETIELNYKTGKECIIGLLKYANLPEKSPEKAMRIIEIMAFGFHDYAARECVCFKKIFI